MKMDNRLVEVYEAPRAEFVEMVVEIPLAQSGGVGGDTPIGEGEEGE